MPTHGAIQNALGMGGGNGSSDGPTYRGKKGYRRTLQQDDFFTSNVSYTTGTWEEAGAFTVGAKQFAEVGQGSSNLDPQEQGRVRVHLEDTADTTLNGSVRITHRNATSTQEFKIVEENLGEIDQSTRSERVVAPRASTQGFPRVSEDSDIVLKFNATNGNGTLETTDSIVRLPITIYE